MDSTPLVRLSGVGKDYPVASSAGGQIRNLLGLLMGRGTSSHFSALSDITFDVLRGQSLGLIGENGAGKSTLLKIIAGVVRPTQGQLSVNGTIGALLELGAGFHPEYTGKENIFLSTALMGMSPAATQACMDDILAFADIGEHIDQPIKHYSSGMVVRLGFAVNTVLRPDILITDEVLAVGDESFQKKCIAWMENYLDGGGTLLLCSHNMFHIQKLCHNAVWIHHGKMHRLGEASEVTREYLAYHEEKSRPGAETKPPVAAAGHDIYRVISLQLNGHEENESPVNIPMGGNLWVSGVVHSPDGRPPNVAIGVVRADGTGIYGVVSDMEDFRLKALTARAYGFALHYRNLQLLPGRYHVRGHAMDPEGLRMFDHVERVLDVTGSTRELGLCRLEHYWHTHILDPLEQQSQDDRGANRVSAASG